MWLKIKKNISPYLMVLPILIVYTGMIIIPAIEGFRLSFTDWDGIYSIPNYIGLANYKKFLTDPDFYESIWITFKMAIFVIVIQNAVGLMTAVALSKESKVTAAIRTVFFIPTLLTMMVVGLVFSYIFSPSYSPINAIGEMIGWDWLANMNWFGSKTSAFWVVVFTAVWTGFGTTMMIYIGGLTNISNDYYESAVLDGAGSWQKFRYITMPLLAPAITINMLMSVINGLKIFDIPYSMTQGGPAGATKTIAIMLYEDAFYGGSAGYAAAESFILLLLVFTISAIQTGYLRSREVDA